MSAVEFSYLSLGFARQIPGGIDLWLPHVTGDYQTDAWTGRQYAHAFVAFVQATDNPSVLARIVKAMIGRGDFTGVEVGFFHRLSEEFLGQTNETFKSETLEDERH